LEKKNTAHAEGENRGSKFSSGKKGKRLQNIAKRRKNLGKKNPSDAEGRGGGASMFVHVIATQKCLQKAANHKRKGGKKREKKKGPHPHHGRREGKREKREESLVSSSGDEGGEGGGGGPGKER